MKNLFGTKDEIEGAIESYIYYNSNTGYSVIKLKDDTIIVGNLPKLNKGDHISATGNWIEHSKYGIQFKIDKINLKYPTDKESIIKYLSSRVIENIGPVTAKRIVAKFGTKTFDVFNSNIEELLKVEGIGHSKLKIIKESWERQKGIKEIILFLQSLNISTNYAMKIQQHYGEDTIAIIKENPYRLVQDIWGITFATADKIALELGIKENSHYRIKAGIIYILNEAGYRGHVYLPMDDVIQNCSSILSFELSKNDDFFNELTNERSIKIVGDKVYPYDLFIAEREIEKSINILLQDSDEMNTKQKRILDLLKNEYTSEQIEAIKLVLENGIVILTGGPGTGKTYTIKGLVDIFLRANKKVALAAPTGRAAKRMAEMIGQEAKTIHRLLEYNPFDKHFNYNAENQLETDLLVVDEISMVDTMLMYNLITAINHNAKILFVGDVNQLPSISPGNVLSDLIESDLIPTVKLTEIFRQAKDSKIISSAHDINHGEIPYIENRSDSDFFFFEESNSNKIPDIILELYEKRLPSKYNFTPLQDIQIISPMYRGTIGVDNLNKLLQSETNKNPILYSIGNRHYRRNDKVMQLRNNYEKNIFNGDIGFVEEVNFSRNKLIILFDEVPVEYDFTDLDEITHAYAITVHKSQGSEYPCVIMPITTDHYIMLQRNLLYTAITRAKELLILIGTKQALSIAVNNYKTAIRYSSLFK